MKLTSSILALLTTAALAAPGDYILQRENAGSPKFSQVLLTPSEGRAMAWQSGVLTPIDLGATYATIASLSGYATTSALTNGLAAKADTAVLSSYATTAALTSGLAGKADTASLSALMPKSGGTFTAPINSPGYSLNGVAQQDVGVVASVTFAAVKSAVFTSVASPLAPVQFAETGGGLGLSRGYFVLGDGSGDYGMSIMAGGTSKSIINFADGTGSLQQRPGQIAYNHATDTFIFRASNVDSVVTITGAGAITSAGAVIQSPPATATPATNGQMVFEATSNTSLTIRLKGTDGVVRSAVLTLAP